MRQPSRIPPSRWRQSARSLLLLAWMPALAWMALPASRAPAPPPPAITQDESPLLRRVLAGGSPLLQRVLADTARYRLQVVFTEIRRTRNGEPVLRHHSLGLDSTRYFYPASMVKLPAVLLALEQLHTLPGGITPDTRIAIGAEGCQTADSLPPDKPGPYPTVARYAHRIFARSDNPAYNHLYALVGPQQLNQALWQRGWRQVRIVQRLAPCTEADNRRTGHVNFWSDDGLTLRYRQPGRDWRDSIPPPVLSESSIGRNGVPTTGNFLPLATLHELLMAALLPEALPPARRFALQPDDYRRLRTWMRAPPSSLDEPYDRRYYHDARMKYLLLGANAKALAQYPPSRYRIHNKVGLALGFVTDCAYIRDAHTGAEFLLSASIYVNANGIVGDGNYQYESVAFPVFAEIGRRCLAYAQQSAVQARR